jgi:hypothetical protein
MPTPTHVGNVGIFPNGLAALASILETNEVKHLYLGKTRLATCAEDFAEV